MRKLSIDIDLVMLYLALIAAGCAFLAHREAMNANLKARHARRASRWTAGAVDEHRAATEDDYEAEIVDVDDAASDDEDDQEDVGDDHVADRVEDVREADEDDLTDLEELDE